MGIRQKDMSGGARNSTRLTPLAVTVAGRISLFTVRRRPGTVALWFGDL